MTETARRTADTPARRPGSADGPLPRIGIIGPLLGVREGWVTSQGEVLARAWRDAGHEVVTASSHPNWLVRLADTLVTIVRRPFDAPAVKTTSARQALQDVLAGAGATLPRRDATDARIVRQVETRTGRIIDSQKDVGGWR